MPPLPSSNNSSPHFAFCHRNSIAHRDLKPHHLSLDALDNLKVFNFKVFTLLEQLENSLLHIAFNALAYIALEIVYRRRGNYDNAKVEVWSCSLILYVLLASHLPFDNSNTPTMC